MLSIHRNLHKPINFCIFFAISFWIYQFCIEKETSLAQILRFFLNFLLLFNYSCMPFLPIPPPHPRNFKIFIFQSVAPILYFFPFQHSRDRTACSSWVFQWKKQIQDSRDVSDMQRCNPDTVEEDRVCVCVCVCVCEWVSDRGLLKHTSKLMSANVWKFANTLFHSEQCSYHCCTEFLALQ